MSITCIICFWRALLCLFLGAGLGSADLRVWTCGLARVMRAMRAMLGMLMGAVFQKTGGALDPETLRGKAWKKRAILTGWLPLCALQSSGLPLQHNWRHLPG